MYRSRSKTTGSSRDAHLRRASFSMNESGVARGEVQTRDLVVIGGSAGALAVIQRILSDLPSDMPAAIFVAIHLGAISHLPEILGRNTSLPVIAGASGMRIERGRVYVAVPDLHLMMHDHHLLLRRGPRENLSRPALDPLFRSAACTFGSRTIGVLVSGTLNDGTAGLQAIKQCGGLAIIQDITDATCPEMPASAQRYVEIDYVRPAAELGPLLLRLAKQPAGVSPPVPERVRLETAIATQELGGMKVNDQLGTLSRFTCPECNGALWEMKGEGPLRYRCHIGHALTAETVLSEQAIKTEEMLWRLMRAHQERAELARRMAIQEQSLDRPALAAELQDRARGYDEDASVVERLLREHRSVVAIGQSDPEEGD